ncbi:colanic acid biosynthesis glycosyl transferase WcaI [Chitinophaga sp. YR573]|nr:colanic acid biosynthesis glycosyl transferase WcaI [Chitinophaga sp. YR573]
MLNPMKNVLVLGINYSPELTGIGKYTSGMVEHMVSEGISCTVVTAFPFYPQWHVQQPYKNRFFKKEVNGLLTIYRCPFYIPRKPSGFKRMMQDISFLLSSSIILLKLIFSKRFDTFITIAPPFHIGFAALLFRFFRNTRVVYHIQDLQIDLAKELHMIKSDKLLKWMFKLEKYILEKADHVSTISEGMINKVKQKQDIPVIYFPNWVDTQLFYPLPDKIMLKKKWGFKSDDHIVLYSGNIGEKQGLDNILHVAERCHNIQFVICGTGAYKGRLLELSVIMGLQNVHFMPLQPIEEFNNFLNMADIHLILQKKNAADLVMPSKLTTILSVGGNIIATASEGTSLYHTIANHNLGLLIEPENIDQLHKAIVQLSATQNNWSPNARTFATSYLSGSTIINQYICSITS